MTSTPVPPSSLGPNSTAIATPHGDVPIEFSATGAVSKGDREAILEMLDKVLSGVDEEAFHIRVRMEHAGDRNRIRPTTLRAVLDLRGGAIRSQVHAETTRGAVEAIEVRLRTQLRHRSDRRHEREHRAPSSPDGTWRHGDVGTARPDYFPRPVDEREIVRHKSVAPGRTTIDEALFDLDMMGYDFYLFVEAATARDALIWRNDDGTAEVECVGGADDVPEHPDAVACKQTPAILDVDGACERLDAGHERWVFFADAGSNRGHVLYRRYDGHYGLIVPIDEPD